MRILGIWTFVLFNARASIASGSNSWRRSSKFNEAFLSVIVVGKTGTGKSTTANTLIDEQKFDVSGEFESVTKQVQYGDVDYNSTSYRIFDTPGYLDVDISSMDVTDQIADWIRSSTHGLDAFLLLLPFGRLGKEHWESFQTFKNSFGMDAINRTIIAVTQLRPSSLSSEEAAERLVACCKPGGQLREACCDVLKLRNQGNPVIGIGDPTDPVRRARDRDEIFEAIQAVVRRYPRPYSNEIFDSIHANRTKLLKEINLLKFSNHRKAMRNLYEDYFAPEVVDQTISKDIKTADIWAALAEFQRKEKDEKEGETAKWGYRFVASVVVSLILEALVSLNEPLMWVERSYRTLLFFALYCMLCITDLGAIGLQHIINLIPPLWIFDVTSLIDLYFKLDDIVPLCGAAIMHLLYISCHVGFRYFCDFFEGVYLTVILSVLIHEIVVRGVFEPPEGQLPVERWAFIVMAISTLSLLCQFDDDHFLNKGNVPVPIWRYRMIWRKPIRTKFEPVETEASLYEQVPEGEYPMKWRKIDTPWDLDSFRNERLERLVELQNTIRLFHKDRGNMHTVQSLEALPPVTINLPPPSEGSEVETRVLRTLLAATNVIGAGLLFLGYHSGIFIACLDILYAAHRFSSYIWYAFIHPDPEVDKGTYVEDWVVMELDVERKEIVQN